MHSDEIIKLYSDKFKASKKLFTQFKGIFPKGVCHDIRNFPPFPFIAEEAKDIFISDIEGNKLIDLWMGHYSNIMGHSHPDITEALSFVISKGIHTGTANIHQLKFAKKLQSAVPELESLRLCSSGTEATMYALRVARAYTGRDLIIKIEGGWHGGNSDLSYSIKPPFDQPSTEGLRTFPPTLSLPINNIKKAKQILESCNNKAAAIIMEPVLGAGGGIKADNEFVKMLRDYCDTTGTLLVFDETITAFRFRYGSISPIFDVEPDLFTMGKIIGGGLHIGMYGGKADIMKIIEAKQLIVGGGTFSANPLSMTAGFAMLELLEFANYDQLNNAGLDMIEYIKKITDNISDIKVTGYNSLFALHFDNKKKENLFRLAMILNGVFTMHGGGTLGFTHLKNDIIQNIKDTYSCSLEQIDGY